MSGSAKSQEELFILNVVCLHTLSIDIAVYRGFLPAPVSRENIPHYIALRPARARAKGVEGYYTRRARGARLRTHMQCLYTEAGLVIRLFWVMDLAWEYWEAAKARYEKSMNDGGESQNTVRALAREGESGVCGESERAFVWGLRKTLCLSA